MVEFHIQKEISCSTISTLSLEQYKDHIEVSEDIEDFQGVDEILEKVLSFISDESVIESEQVSDRNEALVFDYIMEGVPIEVLAEEYHIHPSTVSRWLKGIFKYFEERYYQFYFSTHFLECEKRYSELLLQCGKAMMKVDLRDMENQVILRNCPNLSLAEEREAEEIYQNIEQVQKRVYQKRAIKIG